MPTKPTDKQFEHLFDLAERYGHPGWKKFGGKKYVLLNDNLTKTEADYYARKLREKGHSARITREVARYCVFYRKKHSPGQWKF